MEQPIATALVGIIVAISVTVALISSRFTKSTSDFYVAGRGISAIQNALALSGDYMSAASFLGVAGLVWQFGYDGIWYAAGFFAGWLVLLLFLASPIRRFGAYTIADFVAGRFHSKPLRIAAMIGTLMVSLFYIVPQMVGAGALLGLLLGWNYVFAVTIAGALITIYVVLGGMKATTYNQIIQCILLWTAMFVVMTLALGKFNFSYNELLGTVTEYLRPGLKYNFTNSFALIFGLVLGTAGLPHILIRFYTNPSGRSARWTTVWTLLIIGTFYMMTPVVGLAARSLLGNTVTNLDTNLVLPELAKFVGGEWMMGIVVAGAFAAILSTVAGLVIASTGAIAHDLFTMLVPGASDKRQVVVAKLTSVGVGVIAILTGLLFRGYNVAFLVGLAFAIAASTFFPVLMMGVWWKGTTEKGALAGMIVGMIGSAVMIATNLMHVHTLANPSIITVPASFIVIYLVSKFDGKTPHDTIEFMRKVHMPEKVHEADSK
ncbi:cation acetate symporter [Candidatus Bipolaricaulota bacterium]